MSHPQPVATGTRRHSVEKYAIKVRHVMTKDVVTIAPDTPFPEIVQCLLDKNISGLPVVGPNRGLLGIVTEADLISKEAYEHGRRRHLGLVIDHLTGREPDWISKAQGRLARDLMTQKVETASPDEDLATAARRMLDGHHKQLPVVKNGRLVGIISRHDLLKPFNRSDADLAEDVQAILDDPLRAPEDHHAGFTIKNGIVTLHGTTRHPADAGVLRAFIAGVPGVVAVDDDLSAEEPDPKPGTPFNDTLPWS
jgi:CBS domain-containing protein